jgi:isoleucyl-tRNA synthetase
MGYEGAAPYRIVSTNGWTLDEQGRAQSKSLGNVVDPVDIAERLGAEIVRLWVASVDFREDVTCSEHLMQRVADIYRKIRNTFKHMLGNLYDFDPAKDAVPFERLESLDQYMLRQTAEVAAQVVTWYEEFAFHKIYQRLNQFFAVELSAFYLDILKDRLYISAANSPGRRAAQTAIWRIGEALGRLLAPITSFTSEEIWGFLPRVNARQASVHLAMFPTVEDILGGNPPTDPKQAEDWSALRAVREQVLKALEEARNGKLIGTGLEAKVALTASEPMYSVLVRYKDQLRYVFIVSVVELKQAANGDVAVHVQVSKADGKKCERCWNYSTRVGEDAKNPTVCERCSAVLKEIDPGT